MGNVDWDYFGVSARTQRWIISHILDMYDKGWGNLTLSFRDHKITHITPAPIIKEEEEMVKGENPSLEQSGLAER